MQEIKPGIYYETRYPGVVLGALILPRGTIMIDAPLRVEDGRAWRATLLNRGGGIDRLLINLDAHPDRTIGVRFMECPVVAHTRADQVFRSRSATFKSQGSDAGAEWETCNDLGSSRWALPDFTFTDQMQFNWGLVDVLLEHHPGPAPGATWVILPQAKVVFVGDVVLSGQPPFLAEADLNAWVESLGELLTPAYRSYTLVSGRSGIVSLEDVRKQRTFLNDVMARLDKIWARGGSAEETEKLVGKLLDKLELPGDRRSLYESRLRYGLIRLFNRRLRRSEEIESTEDKDE